MRKKIRLMIFNEIFWDKGLIYSQNILPLMKLKQKNENYIIQYTPPKFLPRSKQIKKVSELFFS